MSDKQQYCTFFLNQTYFGIALQDVREIIRDRAKTRIPLAPPDICGLINLRGQIVTVIDLQRRLEIDKAIALTSLMSEDRVSYNIVVRTKDEIASLLVDDVGDVLEFTKDSFEPPPATLKGRVRELLQGAYQLPDGFLLILDIEKILAVKSLGEV
ncbi:MAG: chemotaxis protein CheW [Hydrococcus sp. Prado102]|jgi:purine-binding chemotaxis protein CheW|nr:chemotaxis protein CheW [Hydrococcus sp. Prado102]